MSRLYKFLYKDVKVKTYDGKIYTGFVDMFCAQDENDDGIESIGILPIRNARSGVELSSNEIETIEMT